MAKALLLIACALVGASAVQFPAMSEVDSIVGDLENHLEERMATEITVATDDVGIDNFTVVSSELDDIHYALGKLELEAEAFTKDLSASYNLTLHEMLAMVHHNKTSVCAVNVSSAECSFEISRMMSEWISSLEQVTWGYSALSQSIEEMMHLLVRTVTFHGFKESAESLALPTKDALEPLHEITAKLVSVKQLLEEASSAWKSNAEHEPLLNATIKKIDDVMETVMSARAPIMDVYKNLEDKVNKKANSTAFTPSESSDKVKGLLKTIESDLAPLLDHVLGKEVHSNSSTPVTLVGLGAYLAHLKVPLETVEQKVLVAAVAKAGTVGTSLSMAVGALALAALCPTVA